MEQWQLKMQSLDKDLNDNNICRIKTIAQLRFIAFYYNFIGTPIKGLDDSNNWHDFVINNNLYDYSSDCLVDHLVELIRTDKSNMALIKDYLFIILANDFAGEHSDSAVKNSLDLELDFILEDLIPNNDHRLLIYCVFNTIMRSFIHPYILSEYKKILLNRSEFNLRKRTHESKEMIESLMDSFMYLMIDEVVIDNVIYECNRIGTIIVYNTEEEENDEENN